MVQRGKTWFLHSSNCSGCHGIGFSFFFFGPSMFENVTSHLQKRYLPPAEFQFFRAAADLLRTSTLDGPLERSASFEIERKMHICPKTKCSVTAPWVVPPPNLVVRRLAVTIYQIVESYHCFPLNPHSIHSLLTMMFWRDEFRWPKSIVSVHLGKPLPYRRL